MCRWNPQHQQPAANSASDHQRQSIRIRSGESIEIAEGERAGKPGNATRRVYEAYTGCCRRITENLAGHRPEHRQKRPHLTQHCKEDDRDPRRRRQKDESKQCPSRNELRNRRVPSPLSRFIGMPSVDQHRHQCSDVRHGANQALPANLKTPIAASES